MVPVADPGQELSLEPFLSVSYDKELAPDVLHFFAGPAVRT